MMLPGGTTSASCGEAASSKLGGGGQTVVQLPLAQHGGATIPQAQITLMAPEPTGVIETSWTYRAIAFTLIASPPQKQSAWQ